MNTIKKKGIRNIYFLLLCICLQLRNNIFPHILDWNLWWDVIVTGIDCVWWRQDFAELSIVIVICIIHN